MEKRSLGNYGEDKAARYLARKGYRIVERNFRCRFGEIDIIAEKGGFVVFVEVKLRKNAVFAEAREFVTATKQRRIISAASIWISNYDVQLQPRFDVIEVYAPEGLRAFSVKINHIEDAFC